MAFSFEKSSTFVLLVVGCLFLLSWSCVVSPASSKNLPNCKKNFPCALVIDECLPGPCTNMSSGLCCAQNLYCIDKICVTDNLGSTCQTVLDCSPPVDGTLNIACQNNVCVEKYNTGDSCNSNSDCVSDSCDSGSNTCIGILDGSVCPGLQYPFSQPCVYGSHCVGLVCLALLQENAICLGYGCGAGLVCSEGFCKPLFSVPQQGSCDLLMSQGLECQSHESCVPNLGLLGQCLPGKNYEMNTCESNSDCDSSNCQCSPFTGLSTCELPVTATNCQSEQEDLLTCMNDNDCAVDPNATPQPNNAPLSCTKKHCNGQYIANRVCQCYVQAIQKGDCYYEHYCSKLGLWIIIGAAVAALVILILFCCCVACICSRMRRKTYTSV